MSTEPAVTIKPIPVDVEAGKSYFWCTCGRSAKQPFCDGAHGRENTGMAPLKWAAVESKTVYFCTCKATGHPPLCDGSHKALQQPVSPA